MTLILKFDLNDGALYHNGSETDMDEQILNS